MAAAARPPKYAPLVSFLTDLPADTRTVTLTLAEIEDLIGAALPAGAATQVWWLRSRGRAPQRAWTAAGWRVAGTAMRAATPTVTFARQATDRGDAAGGRVAG